MDNKRLINVVRTYGRLIKFSHTIFALPFALSAVVLASRITPIAWKDLFWIIIAVMSARSAAMGFNRWADRIYDRINPRTSTRPSVTGEISTKALIHLIVISSIMFLVSAYMLGSLCFYLSFPVLFILLFYSYTKRFTKWCHLFLGFAIGLAPVGAWIAITKDFSPKVLPLSFALMTYIAGFDILYACMDIEFDRKMNIFSLPATLGVEKALKISAYLHILTFFFLLLLAIVFNLGKVYLIFLVLIGLLLSLEHWLVKPKDLSKIPLAFFHVNSAVSVLLFIGIIADSMG